MAKFMKMKMCQCRKLTVDKLVTPLKRLGRHQFSHRLGTYKLDRSKLHIGAVLSNEPAFGAPACVLGNTAPKISEDLVMLLSFDLPYLEEMLLIKRPVLHHLFKLFLPGVSENLRQAFAEIDHPELFALGYL